jgi:flagellar protein FliS
MNNVQIYQDVSLYSEVLGASSKVHIQLLLDKSIGLINRAAIALEEGAIAQKCRLISQANDIVLYLQDCLNHHAEPEYAAKLQQLYQHIEQQLFIANSKNDAVALQICETMLENLALWWKKMGED